MSSSSLSHFLISLLFLSRGISTFHSLFVPRLVKIFGFFFSISSLRLLTSLLFSISTLKILSEQSLRIKQQSVIFFGIINNSSNKIRKLCVLFFLLRRAT